MSEETAVVEEEQPEAADEETQEKSGSNPKRMRNRIEELESELKERDRLEAFTKAGFASDHPTRKALEEFYPKGRDLTSEAIQEFVGQFNGGTTEAKEAQERLHEAAIAEVTPGGELEFDKEIREAQQNRDAQTSIRYKVAQFFGNQ